MCSLWRFQTLEPGSESEAAGMWGTVVLCVCVRVVRVVDLQDAVRDVVPKEAVGDARGVREQVPDLTRHT